MPPPRRSDVALRDGAGERQSRSRDWSVLCSRPDHRMGARSRGPTKMIEQLIVDGPSDGHCDDLDNLSAEHFGAAR